MPRSTPFEPAQGERASGLPAEVRVATADRDDRASVFSHLVKDDGDIVGLVAYSIYKQNKLDWLRAFESARGRAPEENELVAYIIGEGTPRRLVTYRHLAEATLAGNGPEVGGTATAPRSVLGSRRFASRTGEGYATGMIALYGLIAVLFVLGFYLAMHYTGASR